MMFRRSLPVEVNAAGDREHAPIGNVHRRCQQNGASASSVGEAPYLDGQDEGYKIDFANPPRMFADT